MLRRTIKLDRSLWERVKVCAEKAGYSSPQEFVEHAIEQEVARLEEADSKDEVLKKLKGLGYVE